MITEEVNRLSKEIIGAAIEVHRYIGAGFLESVYEEALCIELAARKIPFVRQAPLSISYRGHEISAGRLDLLVQNSIIVELKAVEQLAPIHTAQIISYLKASKLTLGLLMNFNVLMLKDGIKRIVL